MSSSLRLVVALAVSLLSVASATVAAPATKIPGQAYFGTEGSIEYVAGNLPIGLTSPHGGRLKPDPLPHRQPGVTDTDANTQELARLAVDVFTVFFHERYAYEFPLAKR